MQVLHQTNKQMGAELSPYWGPGHQAGRGVSDAPVALLMPQGPDFFCRKESQAKEVKDSLLSKQRSLLTVWKCNDNLEYYCET